ncbi:hypothetical protein ACFLVF_00385 [Chloroflexota bacterium]
MGGYKNKILRVDLSDRSFAEEPLSPELIYHRENVAEEELARTVKDGDEINIIILVSGG